MWQFDFVSSEKTKPVEVVDKFAAERSHRDAEKANDFAKALCQVLLAINGLSVSALLTYSVAQKPLLAIPVIAIILTTISFLVGVIFAVVANVAFLDAAQAWATKWQCEARGWHDGKGEHQESRD